MAKSELIKIDDFEMWGFNVSETVGIGGKNEEGDVMLIQAMFYFLGAHGELSSMGVKSLAELTGVDGKYSNRLGQIILNYQKTKDYLLLNVDGLIHPASYKDRNIKFEGEGNLLMTITCMHLDMAVGSFNGDYATDFLRFFPVLGVWLQ
jgi:hypothetical protein